MTLRAFVKESAGTIILVAVVLSIPVGVGFSTWQSSRHESFTFGLLRSTARLQDQAEIQDATCRDAVERSQYVIKALRDSLSTVRRVLKNRSAK